MSQDLIGLNGGGGNVDSTVTNDAHLVVLIGQTNSSDEVKLTLSLLNAALAQIGKPVQEHLTDIVNAIRHKQYEKSSYDQQQRIGYSNDVNFTFELLVNPLVRSVRQSFKNALTSDRKLKYVVNLSGDRAIQGDVNCSDASISCDDLLIMLGDAAEFTDEQRKALKSAQKSFTLLMPQRVLEASRSWKAALEKQYTSISVQPINTAAPASENGELNESLTQLLNQTPIDQLLVTPPYTGTLKVTRPSLYIFPSEQGDAAYFALNGYSMLINGGYDRLRPSFWKFVNLLQQIDSVLLTHADVDALGGLVGLFGKKAADTAAECKPQVLTLLGNFVRSATKPQADTPTIKTDVDVILDAVEKLNVRLMPLVKTNENLLLPFNKSASVPNKYEHINLYSKLGHGSLDLYVLSPFVNSPEYKEFYLQQQQSFARQTSASANLQKAHLAVHGVYKHLPLSHLATSVCLLVWLPAAPTHRQSAADPAHNALRLLFTGNAPQHVILNALDKLKDFELLNEPIYRVKPEPAPHQPIQSLKKQTSASGVGSKTESSSTNGKLNTSISSKPVGTANGHHTDHHDEKEKDIKQPIKSSKPPVPSSSSTHNTTAAAAKPSQPAAKSTTTKSTTSSYALNTSVSKDVKDGAASGKHEKKPPVNNSAAPKKKPEHSEDKEKSGTDKVVTASSEKPKEAAAKKTGSVGKKETSATNGSGPVKSETSTNSRASLSKAADNKEKEKPEAKPPVPKQQPAKSSTTASKPPAGDAKHENKDKPSGHKTETKPDSGKKSLPSSKPASTAAATKKTSTGGAAATAPKTLTLSMSGGDGSVIKGGVVAAAAAATASVVAATVAAGVAETPVEQQTPTPSVESVPVVSQEATSTQQQQCPSSVESVEMRLHQNEEEVVATESAAAEEVASSQQPSSDIIQQIEQVEQIEKIEQVVNVEHVIEEILPPTTTTTTTTEEEVVTTPTQEEQVLIEQPQEHQPPVENQSQEEEGDVASSNNYAHESPNLSPVKKDFPTLNHSQHVEAPESTSESAVVNEIHEHHHHEEPVVEEQLTSEAVTTNDIEIVSGNLNGDAALEEVSEQLRGANDDVMTRSFIEDASNPASNPFAAPLIPTTNGENGEQTNGVQTNGTNGNHHHLDESCDLNRTHELFEGDESSSSLLSQQAPSQTNGNGVHGDGEEINGGTNGTNGTNGVDKHEESLISSLEALKLANQSANHHVEATNGAGEPHTWNLLELPKPVNPADNGVVDPSNVDLVHDKVEIDSKPDATSSPAGGQQSVSAAIGSDKKPIANGKGSSKAPNRNSVDPSSKPATQNNNTNSNSAPSKPSKPIHPAYVELAYIPAHGAESHVDAEFFKRVRARHYVLSALEPNEHALNALCEGKEVWEDKQLSVTLVPTYESEALRKWFMVNEERLQRLKIDITPAAQHANITIDDNPDLSCQVYKLEF